jgi:hypothetical protein
MMTAVSPRTAVSREPSISGSWGHPSQKHERAVRVPVVYTRLLFTLATLYRLLCAQEATGGEPVRWQRWRCQRFEQSRDLVIVFAQGYDGIFHMPEDLLQVGVSIKDRPPGLARARKSWHHMGSYPRRESSIGTLGEFLPSP